MLTVTAGQAELPAALFRLQDHAADGGRQARARGDEHRHQPRRDRQGDPARQCRSGLHVRRSGSARLRPGDRQASSRRTSNAPRSCSTKPAGSWARRHPREGRHEAGSHGSTSPPGRQLAARRRSDPGLPAQDRRRLAACSPWDSTIASAKMAEQDYEIWSVTVPYLSAGDLMNIYFDFGNIPTPNRMNWKDAETDRLAEAGPLGADRSRPRQILRAGAAEGDARAPLDAACSTSTWTRWPTRRSRHARPHMIYQNTFYKGLDVTRQK